MTHSARPHQLLRFRIPLLLVILTLHAIWAGFERGDLIDDAYISARYARNLAQGYGLVYNRGAGLTRVEGYSNFIWVLILAAGQAAGANPRAITQTAGIAANLLTLLLVWLLVRRWRRPESDSAAEHYLDLAAPLLLAINLPFLIWASAGLETSLFALEIILTFILWGRGQGPRYPALATALLAALTRPEGLLLFIALVLARTAELVRRRERLLKSDVRNLLAFLIPYLVYFLWRFFYYGHSVFPNSYYAKVDPGRIALKEGLFYLFSWLEWGSLPLLLLLGFGAYGLSRRRDRLLLAPALFLGLYLGFILYVGGDWMPDFRFLTHLEPLLVALSVLGIIQLESLPPNLADPRWRRHRLARLVILLALGMSLYRYTRYELSPSFDRDWHRHQGQFYRGASRWVLQHVWRSETVAAGDIGYLGFISDVDRIVDTMGLCDRHLARLPGIAAFAADLDYLFAQDPFGIVMMVHRFPDGQEIGHSETDRALAKDPRLNQRYRLRSEIFGWDNLELSRSDRVRRQSQVWFKLYTRRLDLSASTSSPTPAR